MGQAATTPAPEVLASLAKKNEVTVRQAKSTDKAKLVRVTRDDALALTMQDSAQLEHESPIHMHAPLSPTTAPASHSLALPVALSWSEALCTATGASSAMAAAATANFAMMRA